MIETLRGTICRLVRDELTRARVAHGDMFHSDHEAIAVTWEEVEEAREFLEKAEDVVTILWRYHVRHDIEPAHFQLERLEKFAVDGAAELIQVAAMARKWKEGLEND